MNDKSPVDDNSSRQLLKGTTLAFALRVVGAACAFALNVMIGRLLGVQGAGLYYIALSVSSIGAVIARLGMDHATLRFVAAEIAHDNWNRAAGVLVQAIKLTAISGLVMSLAVLATARLISEHVFSEPNLAGPLRWISLSILTFALMMLMAESLKGLSRVRDSMLVSGVIYPVVALALIWPLSKFLGASGAALAYVLGTGVAMIFGFVVWRRQGLLIWARPVFELDTLWASANQLWVASMINSALLPWAPLFLLGVWGSTEDTGIFGAAGRLATLITFLLVAVNTVAAPRFSKLYAKGHMEDLRRLACRFSLFLTLVTSPILVLIVLQGSWLMELFGQDFTRGGMALSILALGQAVNAATGSVGPLLMMTGHEQDIRNSSIFAAVLMGISALILIPSHGLLGAAISSATAVAGMNLFNSVLVKLRLGFFVFPK